MGPSHLLRIQIELERDSEPVRGRLRAEQGEELDFLGILEMLALLDELRDAAKRPGEGSP